ncbi:MAG: alginate lyase family protein [Bacteroidaceae bacterium]|nr:alginate lyase family protein [Bacteroidaceae bacterium]
MKTKLLTLALLLVSMTAGAQATAINTDRGFIHPGGLHTQADFDRVKAQIAAKNSTILKAWNKLRNAEYAQSSVQTSPVETIVRGGSGENYINAARGATMAYQNALRWKIGGTAANAKAAVRILMAWCNKTTAISGTSDQCLAAGLYGYQFAQAAELMRDYEGWKAEEFEQFRQWMLTLWYPKAIGFLRGRNGTWENSGKWWQAPGHYWSNWGLCNVLCVMSIGILCDNVQIYNEGVSFIKYDQVGNYTEPPTLHDATGPDGTTVKAIHNDGLTEFWGNLIVTAIESELETGAYGQLGQMNESGRDTGHSSLALGLAVDIAKVAYNQGDDLFAYMNHRLAAGIEYVAAQTQSTEGLPWTNYHYGSSGYYYSDSRAWLMTEPALGAQMRPYWGTVIGMYEGTKGVVMPFAEMAYKAMGIDDKRKAPTGENLGAFSKGMLSVFSNNVENV